MHNARVNFDRKFVRFFVRSMKGMIVPKLGAWLGHGCLRPDLGDLDFRQWRNEDSRTRGLTEVACLTLAQEVRGRTTIAYCYPDGTPDPGWRTKPIIDWHRICDECGPLPGLRWV